MRVSFFTEYFVWLDHIVKIRIEGLTFQKTRGNLDDFKDKGNL